MNFINLQVQPVSFSCPYLKLFIDDKSMSKMAPGCLFSQATQEMFLEQQQNNATRLLTSLCLWVNCHLSCVRKHLVILYLILTLEPL